MNDLETLILPARPRIQFVTVIAFACIAWIIIAADRRALPGWIMNLYDFPGGDKLGHLILFGGLTCLTDLALRGRTLRLGIPLPVAGVGIALLETIEETSLAFLPSRTVSLLDLGASYIGIALGIGIASALRRCGIGAPRRP